MQTFSDQTVSIKYKLSSNFCIFESRAGDLLLYFVPSQMMDVPSLLRLTSIAIYQQAQSSPL